MATLSEVRDHIKSDLVIVGSTDYDSQIDNAVRSAIRLHYGKRFPFLKTDSSITLVSGDSSVALPSDFGAPESFALLSSSVWLVDGRGFDFLTYERFIKERANISPLPSLTPTACAVLGSTLYVDSLANSSYTIKCIYYKKDSALPTGDSDTSVWLGDDGYDVIRSRAMEIFKRESANFTSSPSDMQAVDFYYSALCQSAQRMEGGR